VKRLLQTRNGAKMKSQRRGTRMQAVFGWAIAIRSCLLLGVPLVYLALTATMLHDAPGVEPRDAGEGGVAIFSSSFATFRNKVVFFTSLKISYF
jgi:hypothetical protein